MIPEITQALAGLDYPAEHFQVVLIDDGSKDNSRAVMEDCLRDHPGWYFLSLNQNLGKAAALNTALKQFTFGELIFIYDADHRPEPDAIRRFVKYFEDDLVAGVSGRTIPSNPTASPSAYYSTVENYLNQMVTMRAKDGLNLAPALLGSNCGYRREHLLACGGFRSGALSEDSDLTLTFYRAGYKVRFAEDAIAYHHVPETIQGYLKQHVRWGRGLNDVSKQHARHLLDDRNLRPLLRLELFMFSTGYLDRIALLFAGGLTVLSLLFPRLFRFPRWVLGFAFGMPFIQITGLFAEQRVSREMWKRLPWVPVFFGLDIYAALVSSYDSLLNRPRVWTKTERQRGIGQVFKAM